MAEKLPKLRWGVEQRLEFIEFRLYWEGGINRSDIIDFFSVSVPQASKDLSQYQELAPGNIHYDRSEKRYLATDDFEPLFPEPDAARYLTQLKSIAENVLAPEEFWGAGVPAFEVLPMPRRNIDAKVLRAILAAIRAGKAIEVKYQSLSGSRPKPVWRWITPHAFGFDGMRWHVRAFCQIDRQFKDFLLSRTLGARKEGVAEAQSEDDLIWSEKAIVALKPHPGLTEDQQSVVARDYGMRKNILRVEVRLALLYYFLKRLGLDFSEENCNPREQHIVLANTQDVRAACERANVKTSMWGGMETKNNKRVG